MKATQEQILVSQSAFGDDRRQAEDFFAALPESQQREDYDACGVMLAELGIPEFPPEVASGRYSLADRIVLLRRNLGDASAPGELPGWPARKAQA